MMCRDILNYTVSMIEIGPPELNLIIQEVEEIYSTIVITGECHVGIHHHIFFTFII